MSDKKVKRQLIPIFTTRGKNSMTFQDFLVAILTVALYFNPDEWSWWLLPLYIFWIRPYKVVVEIMKNLIDNAQIMEREKKMLKEELEKRK